MELTIGNDAGPLEGLEALVYSFDGRSTYAGTFVDGEEAGWRVVHATLEPGVPAAAEARRDGLVRYGSRAFEILDVRFYDADGETLQFAVGSSMRVVAGLPHQRPGVRRAAHHRGGHAEGRRDARAPVLDESDRVSRRRQP